jgi:hypothetical protein
MFKKRLLHDRAFARKQRLALVKVFSGFDRKGRSYDCVLTTRLRAAELGGAVLLDCRFCAPANAVAFSPIPQSRLGLDQVEAPVVSHQHPLAIALLLAIRCHDNRGML